MSILNNTETVSKLFDYAIALERAAEILYKQLEKIFAHYPEVALFWKRYAGEENGHAEYLERTKAKVDANRLSQQADDTMLKKTLHCLAWASPKKLINIKTLDDAYQLAIELESSEINTIFEFMIMNFSTNELAKSKHFQAQLNAHITRLENDFPNSYKNRDARQNVLILE
jgi:rubrerythrin